MPIYTKKDWTKLIQQKVQVCTIYQCPIGFAQLARGCRAASLHGAPVSKVKHKTTSYRTKEAPVETAKEEPHHA